MLPVLEAHLGRAEAAAVRTACGLARPPDGTAMIPEEDAARLHRAVRTAAPDRAAAITSEAGVRTADYILGNRIPAAVKTALTWMPAALAAPVLSRAIARNAWTFAGSGRFTAVSPWCFEVAGNPLVRGESSPCPLCHWHAAVFQRLYRTLVAGDVVCRETRCCAQPGATACRFELARIPARRRALWPAGHETAALPRQGSLLRTAEPRKFRRGGR